MRPMGTITMDFQFISGDSRKILEKFMKRAQNYGDYVQLLADHVIDSDEVPDELVLLAIRHCDNLGRGEKSRGVIEAHQTKDAILPHYMIMHAAERDDWELALQEIESAIERSSADWVLYWYLISLYWLSLTRALDHVRAEKAEEEIERMLTERSSIDCYSPQYYYLRANRERYERGMKGPLEFAEKGLEKAREFNDRYFESRCLKQIGTFSGFYDLAPGSVAKGRALLIESKAICEELGDPRGLIEVLSYLGGISGASGAFTDDLRANLETLRVRELIGDRPVYEFHNISVSYCLLQKGKEALEWAKLALDNATSRPLLVPLVHLDLAAALVLTGDLRRAQEHIDIARPLNLESGVEANLAFEHRVTGLLERAKGDYDTAMHSFESALEIERSNSRVNRLVVTLMYLAETEVAAFQVHQDSRDNETSGPWLERYEATATDNNLQGHSGIALCLKSELRLRQGRHEEAREFANNAIHLSKQPGLEFLKERATPLLRAVTAGARADQVGSSGN